MYEDLVKRLRAQADAERYFVGESMLYDVAADAIEELSATISKMEKATRWIPVTERLPVRFKSVLTVDKYGVIAFNWISGDGKNWSTGYHITHWQPLPEPPKEE